MRILIMQPYVPSEPRTPIALMDLAPYWRAQGHDVTVAYVDHLPSLKEYDLVAFSSLTINNRVLRELSNLRRRYSGRIVFGGKATTVLDGPTEDLIGSLGIEIHKGPGELLLSDADAFQFDSYPVWSIDDFRALDRDGCMTEIMAGRGCPYACHFCHNTEKTLRHFAISRTVSNASLVLTGIGRSSVFFVDDLFAVNAKRMSAVYDAVRHNGLELRGRAKFFLHVRHTGKEVIEEVKRYDPPETLLGIESGNDEMLAAMGKTFNSAIAERQLKALHSAGIRVACLFIMGYPGETPQSLRDTVDFVDRNRKYMSGWWVSYYQPVRFTKGWELAKERSDNGLVTGGWNTEINFLDPNITINDLRDARWAVMLH